jgi:cytochrome c biogenesis protein CcdA
MFGVDARIASFSNGTTLLLVVGVSIALGLRHASDPDHLAAVTTLIASGRDRAARRAARLGFAWGLGHATSLFVFGLPIVLYRAYLPEPVQRAAETTVGFMIVVLALLLLLRWRRGVFHAAQHGHVHTRTRGARGAYGIGLVHGMGGTAGVGVLLLGAIHSHALAVSALALFAGCTALSMALLSTGFGLTLNAGRVREWFHLLAPAFGFLSLAFGIWYALGAEGVVPYVF